jgi:hypothetical protein
MGGRGQHPPSKFQRVLFHLERILVPPESRVRRSLQDCSSTMRWAGGREVALADEMPARPPASILLRKYTTKEKFIHERVDERVITLRSGLKKMSYKIHKSQVTKKNGDRWRWWWRRGAQQWRWALCLWLVVSALVVSAEEVHVCSTEAGHVCA